MLLQNIYKNSNYLTDEDMTTTQVVGLANNAISEINTKIGTNLPFFEEDNYSVTEYDAITSSWLLRLIEPYLSFSIVTNDGVPNDLMNFHYNRFLAALNDFESKGLSDIKEFDKEGNATGYIGKAKKSAKVTCDGGCNPFRGWWM